MGASSSSSGKVRQENQEESCNGSTNSAAHEPDVMLGRELYGSVGFRLKRVKVNTLLSNPAVAVNYTTKSKGTPLMRASYFGHLDIVKQLVAGGADIHLVDEFGRNALSSAARGGRLEVLKYLHTQTVEALQVFLLPDAASSGNVACVKYLLDQGIDANSRYKCGGSTALMKAAERGNVEVMKLLLARGVNPAAKTRSGDTAMMYAAKSGSVAAIKLLINYEASICEKNEDLFTPLHWASLTGQSFALLYLITHGADCALKDVHGRTALDLSSAKLPKHVLTWAKWIVALHKAGVLVYSAASGVWTLVMPLEAQAASDLAATPNPGLASRLGTALSSLLTTVVAMMLGMVVSVFETPPTVLTAQELGVLGAQLLKAVKSEGSLEEIQQLLANPGINVDFHDEDKETALMKACWHGHLKIVQALVAAGADIHWHSKYDDTPLSQASGRGNRDIMDFLILHGVAVGSREEGKALTSAASNGRIEIAKFLLDNGEDVNGPRRYDRTPLLVAAGSGHLEMVRLLLERGAKVDSRDHSGESPIMQAAKSDNMEIVKLLLSKGASVHDTDNDGETVLMRATKDAKIGLIRFLVEQGADVKAKSKKNETALIEPASYGKLEIVKFLVERGVDIDAMNSGTYTALHWASLMGQVSTVKYLVERGANLTLKDSSGRTALVRAKDEATKAAFDKQTGKQTSKETTGPTGSKTTTATTATTTTITTAHHKKLDQGFGLAQLFDVPETVPPAKPATSKTDTAGTRAAAAARTAPEPGPAVTPTPAPAPAPLPAVPNGPADAVKALVNAADATGQMVDPTALLTFQLYEAAGGGDVEQVKQLLSAPGLRIDQRIQNSETALIQACYVGHLEVVRLLVEVGGADLNLQDQDGWTALHWAAYNGFVPVVAFLLSKGADTTALTNKGFTAVQNTPHQAVRDAFAPSNAGSVSGDNAAATLSPSVSLSPIEIHDISPITGLDELELNNLLCTSATAGDVSKVRRLLHTPGINIDFKYQNSETALIQACYVGHVPVAQLLVEKGANLNLRDGDGWTALHWAAYNGNAELVKLLLHKGADTTILSKKGSSALDGARGQDVKDLLHA